MNSPYLFCTSFKFYYESDKIRETWFHKQNEPKAQKEQPSID